jgi:hypothetical protein
MLLEVTSPQTQLTLQAIVGLHLMQRMLVLAPPLKPSLGDKLVR